MSAEPLRQDEPAHSALVDMTYVLRMAETVGMSIDYLHGQTLRTGLQIARNIRNDEIARAH